jgi:hypothetical protein
MAAAMIGHVEVASSAMKSSASIANSRWLSSAGKFRANWRIGWRFLDDPFVFCFGSVRLIVMTRMLERMWCRRRVRLRIVKTA